MDHSKKTIMTGHSFSTNEVKQHAPAVNYINITRHPDGGIANIELKRTVTKVITFPQNTTTTAASDINKNRLFENCHDTSPSGYSSPGSNSSLFANDSKLTISHSNALIPNSVDKFVHPKSFLNVNTLLASSQSSISSLSEGSKNSSSSVNYRQTNRPSEVRIQTNNSGDKCLKNSIFPGTIKALPSKGSGTTTNITVIPQPSNHLEIIKDMPAEVSFKVSRQVAPPNVRHHARSARRSDCYLDDVQQSVDALTLRVEEEMKMMNSHIQGGMSRQKSPPPYYGVHLTSVDCLAPAAPAFGKMPMSSMQLQPFNNSFSGSYASRSDTPQDFDVESQISFGVCASCKQLIVDLSAACHAMGHLFHSHCFSCSSCGRKLTDRSFYNVAGKVYCEEDYLYSGFQQTTEKCVICGHFIIETILQALGKSYHPGCFRCSACNQCLDGEPFTVDILDRILCINDYNNMYAPRCFQCGLSIIPKQGNEGCIRILSMDRDFHVECYKCKDCQAQLSDEGGQLCYPLDDMLLCKECHVKRAC